MNEVTLSHTLDLRTGYCPKSRRASPFLTSALLFILLFALGIFLYLAIAPIKATANLPLATHRLSLFSATPTTAEGVFYLLLSATKDVGLFLCLTLLLTFTFFAKPLTRLLLATRALRVAMLVCRLVDWMQLGVFSPAVGACLFLGEATLALVCVLFAAKSATVSQSIRECDNYSALPIFIHLISHLLHLFLAYFATVFTAAFVFLTVRL